jgi:glycosyltransferase involved in cell wall biosynthesis
LARLRPAAHPGTVVGLILMRIVQLTASRFFGSLEWQIVELARALPADYQTTIVSFREDGNCQALLDTAARHGLNARALENDTPRLWSATREIADLLRAERADVVCCHGYKANLLGRRAGRQLGIPVVAIAHGWTGESPRVRIYEAFDRWRLRRMDRVVCVSEGQAVRARKANVAPDRIRMIHNAVDTERFATPKPGVREEMEKLFARPPRHIVGAAGRLSPEKGVDVLIRAARLVLESAPETGFVIFGHGPLEHDLRQLIATEGLIGRVVLAGFTNRLDDYLPHFDVLALSSYTEGLPCVVLEALAAGVPAVATAVGGTPEVLVDGECGWLTPAGNVEILAERIVRCLADDEARLTLGAAGRRRVAEHFSFARQSQQYQKLFAELAPHARDAITKGIGRDDSLLRNNATQLVGSP